MQHSERIPFTVPEDLRIANKTARVDPNKDFPSDAVANVFTDDGHLLSFRMFKKGPEQPDYLISLVDSKPPITTYPPGEKEVYVKEDLIAVGKEFTLDSMFPIVIGRTTFRAMKIFSNVDTLIVPLDDHPSNTAKDVEEAI